MHAFGWVIIGLFVVAGALGVFGHHVEASAGSPDEAVGSAFVYLAAMAMAGLAVALLIGWALVRLAFY